MYKNYCSKTIAHFLKVCYCLLIFNSGFSQTNLVPDYSFEQYTVCPTLGTPPPAPWYEPTNYGGAGYFNGCSGDLYTGIPSNTSSSGCYQYPRTGNAYIGLFYLNFGMRNYVQIKLNKTLIANKRYYCEHFVNLPEGARFACNNVGMLFTQTSVYVDTANYSYGVLPANPQILNYGNPIIIDTMNWVKVSGIYTAQGGEQYLTLGNFKYDSNTVKKEVNPNGYYGAGYIIDDVSVYELDSFNLKADAGRDSTIHIGDSVFIGSLTNGIDSLKWQIQNTGIAIDSTRPGFWVHPLANTCYVLTQTVNGFTSSDTVCINVQPLPLKMLGFTAMYQPTPSPSKEGNVLLQWQTANEINVSHFNVQRSLNGRDFINIGKVVANNKSYNEYGFIDDIKDLELGIRNLYFRIQSVDFDGQKQYSTIQQITIKHQTPNIVLFPNPAKEFVTVECKGAKELLIIDYLGRTIKQYNHPTEHQTINTKQLTKGVYVVKVFMNNGDIKTERLIIE